MRFFPAAGIVTRLLADIIDLNENETQKMVRPSAGEVAAETSAIVLVLFASRDPH
jgi:hypothetical protein